MAVEDDRDLTALTGHIGDRTHIFLPYGACERTSHHLRPHHDDLREILGLGETEQQSRETVSGTQNDKASLILENECMTMISAVLWKRKKRL